MMELELLTIQEKELMENYDYLLQKNNSNNFPNLTKLINILQSKKFYKKSYLNV